MIDQQVFADLAALGRDGQQHVPAIDDLLRGLGEKRRTVAPTGGLALLPIANLYADRVARAAGGAMALLMTVILVVAASPLEIVDLDRDRSLGLLLDNLVSTSVLELSVLGLLVIAGTMLVARRIAARELEHELRRSAGAGDSLAIARRAAGRIDGWSIVLWVAGMSSLLIVIVGLYYAAGPYALDAYRARDLVVHRVPVAPMYAELFEVAAIAIAIAIVEAIVVGRLRPRLLASRALAWSCAAVALGVIYTGFAYNTGIATTLWQGEAPRLWLRMTLEIVGAAGVLGATTGFALRRRCREQARLDSTAAVGDELSLFPFAASVADRAASIAGGAAMLIGSIALLVLDLLPLDGEVPPIVGQLLQLDNLMRPLLVISLALGARVIARERVERSFVRLDPGDRSGALRLVRSLDRWSVALAIAGSTTLVVTFGAALFLHESHGDNNHVAIAIVDVVAIVAAVAVARACGREHRWLPAIGHRLVLVIATTLAVGSGLVLMTSEPSYVRSAMACGIGVGGVFLGLTAHVLRRRRREHA